ncbi:cytochrome-c peroxidase [Dyadobacter subterraneus]|uniref:C-type cytochrome n=1 Tax=Dyadobacter subterraneus TaxID=2773304 RepID=A0ABR9WDL2_9BACT|nr:cytochrome c peroxidase [Dyadobacter subterraneus]MBE9463574.1 c-type cytochrome [Dyadobacter subterraneus]
MPKILVILMFFSGIAMIGCKSDNETPDPQTGVSLSVSWKKPSHFPEPVYDMSKNPMTAEGVELGRFLFYDGILSRTNAIGCGTCHQQSAAFTHHGHDLSHGIDDLLGTRNAPAVQNLAWSTSFFWDGGVHDLDFVPPSPIQNKVEMGETVSNVMVKLRNTPVKGAGFPVNYPQMFKAAFGTEEINTERMMKALSQFMLSMVSATSRYDYYVLGDASAITAQEKEGLGLFKQKCGSCHAGELFTDFSFRNNGLSPNKINDQGRYAITLDEADRMKFKVPSLRNVGLTAPYMHDGRYRALSEVLDHYANDQNSSKTDTMYISPTLDPVFLSTGPKPGIRLTAQEKLSIIAFLKTLNDEQFISDKRFSDPGVGTAL